MPKPWRTLTAPVIVLILTAPAILSAQPLQLPRGTEINVKLGGGTSFQEGTRLTGTVVSEGLEGLRFHVPDRGLFYVKWTHIHSINGIPINEVPEAQSRPAPQEAAPRGVRPTPVPVQYVPVSEHPVPAPTPNRSVLGSDRAAQRKWDSAPRHEDSTLQRSSDGHFLVSIDYFGTGNAAKGVKDYASSQGITDGTYNATGGWGLTGGYLSSLNDYIDVGGSLSFIAGPNATLDSDKTAIASSVSYVRLLALGHFNLPISDDWGLHLILGAGPAVGWQKETILKQEPLYFPTYAFSAAGLAWKVGPSISYRKWELMVGAAGLPRITTPNGFDAAEMKSWTTFEANLSYSF